MIETVYFGTYTKKTAQGIYIADFDTLSGKLDNLRLLTEIANPTYLAFSRDDFLYTIAKEEGNGGAAALTIKGQIINTALEEGAPLCYLSVDDKRQLVYGANYHKGQVLVYKKAADGSINLVSTLQHEGSRLHPNQSQPHVHFTDLTPDNYLVTCDLGTDSVTTYDIEENGKLKIIGNYQASPGAGARHLIFHPSYKIAYLICELNGTIETLFYDGYGEFFHYQTISTLPDDYQDFNACSAIRMSKDGRFLYASNRGHNSIAVFKIVGDGMLERLQIIASGGQTPRDFNLSPDDNFLLVGHQDSDNVVTFKRNFKTGLLTKLADFAVPEVVCVAFKEK